MELFRNNAVYGLCFTILCLIVAYAVMRLRKKKCKFLLQLSLVFGISIIGSLGGFRLLETGLHAGKGSVAEMLSIPCQQLARSYVYHGEEMEAADKELLFSYIPEENLLGYKEFVSDPVKAGLDADYLQQHKKEFLKLWMRIGLEYPGEYLLAPLYNTMGVWYLGGDSSCFVLYDMMEPFDENHVIEAHSLLPGLQEGYRWFTDANIQKRLPMVSILFYTSLYSWLVVICTFALIGKRRYHCLVLPAVLFGYLLSLIPGPCIIVRYMMGIMLSAPVLLAVTFGKTEGTEGAKRTEGTEMERTGRRNRADSTILQTADSKKGKQE